MTGAMVILAAMIVVGLLLFITDVKYYRHHHAGGENSSSEEKTEEEKLADRETPGKETAPEVCCGMHLVCEKTSLSIVNDEILYYDDEELDRFAGRTPESYTNQEVEEFRDVLLTLLPQDVAGWAKSITLRRIELPLEVKDELFLMISELRGGK